MSATSPVARANPHAEAIAAFIASRDAVPVCNARGRVVGRRYAARAPTRLAPRVRRAFQIVRRACLAGVAITARNVLDLLADNMPRVPLKALRALLPAVRPYFLFAL